MVFSSIIFLFFFLPIFLWVYFLTPKKYRNIVILLGSSIFYAWESPRFIFVILGTTILDFYFVQSMDRSSTEQSRKLWLCLSLSLNLGLLFYFKYCNFFIDNINTVLAAGSIQKIEWLKVILPIGISFYTFESVTYVVDVYRRVHKPLTKFWDYQLYIILFPKLIAGPIIRYHEISDQIHDRVETTDLRLRGFYRFMIGMAKKVLIANVMASYATDIYSHSPEISSQVGVWIGALAYTFQIYFDFSGYSDMAIGIGMMMGFHFPENFNSPYTSKSITEFWRRWHITLGAWMRNYLYIPLGGNKRGNLYLNLWIVFLASGFWHGAAWAFIFWGAYHGFFLVLERAFLGKYLQKLPSFLSIFYCFFVVLIGWVFFNVEDFGKASEYVGIMFFGNAKESVQHPIYHPAIDGMMWFYFIVAAVFSYWASFPIGEKIQNSVFHKDYSFNKHAIFAFISLLLLVLCAAKIIGSDFNPFIYFRF